MAQSHASILVHLVFSTKDRRPFIKEDVQQELYSYMSAIAIAHKSHVYRIGGMEDHVHLFISLPRTIALSGLVEEIKKGSSKWIKTKGNFYRDFSWQKGFGAFSIGESNAEALKKYIENQKEHHKKRSFQDEYLALLKKYGIEFDERYLWD